MKSKLLFIAILIVTAKSLFAQNFKDCYAQQTDSTLTLGNSKIERTWKWNKGNIIAAKLEDKVKKIITLSDVDDVPSFNIEGLSFVKNQSLDIKQITNSVFHADHLEATLISEYDNVSLKRIFRIFPEVAALSSEVYLKYSSLSKPEKTDYFVGNGIEKVNIRSDLRFSYTDRFRLNSRHWFLKFVQFQDITDGKDNLVFEKEVIPYYRYEEYPGNLLIGKDLVSGNQIFILKEAPNTKSQINYPEFDFIASNKAVNVAFSGFETKNTSKDWIKGYTVTVGVGGNEDILFSLRNYLKKSTSYGRDTHEMILMNTWGDRGQDGKISEKFILNELENAKKLGITHFQIDDGWQQGISKNSADKTGNLWDAWTAKDWEPNAERFPNGLSKIIKSAKEKNIELGLWFHPSNHANYQTWKQDADIVIDLYKKHGVKYFKVDGVVISTKQAETNFTKFLEEVKTKTNGEVFFNLDLTANIRGGHFMFRYAGNLFLENRYTDSGRYFPFHTLRNLWMLSAYFPPEFLQIEFLNKWRNPDKYASDDPFAPKNYDFDYIFAITTFAQPLAWLETANLPDEAYKLSVFINKYKTVMSDIHNGTILPLGEMPSGNSWTGFQSSLNNNEGYIIVFRERNKNDIYELKLAKSIANAKFEVIHSNVSGYDIKLKNEKTLSVKLPKENSFVLLKYKGN